MDGALRSYIANRSGAAHHQAPQEAVDEMNYNDERRRMLEHLYDYTQRGEYGAGGKMNAPYGVIDQGDKIILGSPHGEPIELSEDLKNAHTGFSWQARCLLRR
jgi:hypothetical protein